ncbi:hypothetical protein Pfo_004229 [Paulownia fortunei]|nr:hypothetical protein Pfo_004229 [Paulownia fortunei]
MIMHMAQSQSLSVGLKIMLSGPICEGVEKVKADCDSKKLAVTGNVDPVWLRERVENKTKKKVELISPQPKKDGGDGGASATGGDKKAEEKSEKKTEENKADDNKKPKEAVVSTVVMKIKLHCDGCAHKIKRIILKNIDGVTSVTTDLQKDLVTLTGTMDVKELAKYLREKLKRGVEIVPPKKDDGGEKKGEEGGGDKKEKGGGGGGGGEKKEKENGGGSGGGGGEKKEKEDGGGGGGGGEKKEGGGDKKESESKPEGSGGDRSKDGEGTKVEVNKMEHHSHNPQTYFAVPMYNQTYANQDYGLPMYHHHHQGYSNTGYVVQYTQGPPPPPPTYLNMNDDMFSDENPNGCFVM